jgi:hypothetical protein
MTARTHNRAFGWIDFDDAADAFHASPTGSVDHRVLLGLLTGIAVLAARIVLRLLEGGHIVVLVLVLDAFGLRRRRSARFGERRAKFRSSDVALRKQVQMILFTQFIRGK